VPKCLAQAVLYALGAGAGAEADKARKRADEVVRAHMSYCDRLQAADVERNLNGLQLDCVPSVPNPKRKP
jgi:hypothetical protein